MPEDDPLSSSGIRHEVGMHTASIPSRSRLIALAHSLRLGTTVLRARLSHSHKDVLRPRLADNVRLLGPMTESAFAAQPWLVERNGRFLQVTEFLYRVAELSDGTRTIDRIAADASNAIGAKIPADLVQRTLESRLVPMGLIAADAAFHVPAGASRPAATTAPRSPLALSMRMAVINPRLIDPLTRVLQYLYSPLLLLLLLFLTLQAQYWLLFVHGVAGGIYQALNVPGVLPLVLALVVSSAAFHELGHAAALRYGGGRVRSMGVGFYLMYPAFYTDVTDNYRLRRWARVRTDLGGFYFNLVFSLGLMAIYHVTGQEFLLLVALLTDIDIAHQCLPFVRLDGYWALADLTGIPDFFSFMGAYLRSVLPVPGWKGRRLPALKWWAKAVFALYIAFAIPAIALFLFATLKATPRVLVTAWAAVHQKLADVTQAQATGDAIAAASAESQVLLLLLPVFGLLVMLFTLGRSLAWGLWRWGRPTRRRRLASGFVSAAIAALLVFLWLPGLPNPATYARVLDWFRTPDSASAAAPLTADERGTIPQAVAAIPAARVPTPARAAASASATATMAATPTDTGSADDGGSAPTLSVASARSSRELSAREQSRAPAGSAPALPTGVPSGGRGSITDERASRSVGGGHIEPPPTADATDAADATAPLRDAPNADASAAHDRAVIGSWPPSPAPASTPASSAPSLSSSASSAPSPAPAPTRAIQAASPAPTAQQPTAVTSNAIVTSGAAQSATSSPAASVAPTSAATAGSPAKRSAPSSSSNTQPTSTQLRVATAAPASATAAPSSATAAPAPAATNQTSPSPTQASPSASPAVNPAPSPVAH